MFRSCRLYFLFFFCLFFSYGALAGSSLPGFTENKGQLHDQSGRENTDVLFMYSLPGMNVQLRRSGYSYELFSAECLPSFKPGARFIEPSELLKTKLHTSRVDIDFLNSSPGIEVIREKKNPDRLNYFISGQQITEVQSYGKITYKNVFPSTDIEFLIEPQEKMFKYNIILHKGADIGQVKFLVRGADLLLNETGELVFPTALGSIAEQIPNSFYTDSPSQSEKVQFLLYDHTISFSGKQEASRELLIDPSSSRIWGTYFGGTSLDYCNATGIDAANNVYITGYTLSTAGIATTGAFQSTLAGSYDIYLAKFDPAGNRIWATYYGGSSFEQAFGMYVSPAGTIYICGDTFSTSGVATAGAHQTTYGGGIDDALLVKFDSAGMLKWATYYGGTLHDIAIGVGEDSNGNVILSGHTESATGMATAGSFNNTFYGGFDVFVVKFDSTGVRQWGTYYGEIDIEETFSLAVDPSDNIYITGFTTSSNNIATASGFQTSYSGQQDAFIAKFNPSGTALLYGTYYGGPGNDQGTGIRLSSSGDIIVTGNTTSAAGIASAGAWQTTLASAEDVFVARFNASGARIWGTYFGGDDTDYSSGFIFDANGNIVFCGSAMSNTVIATSGAYQNTIGVSGNYDAYVERFDINGVRQVGTYYGGNSGDHGRGITIDSYGKIYVCGETQSTNAIASPGSHDASWNGSDDAFLAKFCLAPEPVVFPEGATTICEGDTLHISVQNGFASYLWSNGSGGNPFATSDTLSAATYYYTVTVSDGSGCDAMSDTATVIVDVCASIMNISETSFEIYPVPSSGELYIELGNITGLQNAVLTIYSATGQLMMGTETREARYVADIKKLSPGIYILQVRVNGALYMKRFMKE